MQTLEVAIGLVFVYLMLSLVCTAANELLSQWFNSRATTLKAGIDALLRNVTDPIDSAAEALSVKRAVDAHAAKESEVAAHAPSELAVWKAAARAAEDAALVYEQVCARLRTVESGNLLTLTSAIPELDGLRPDTALGAARAMLEQAESVLAHAAATLDAARPGATALLQKLHDDARRQDALLKLATCYDHPLIAGLSQLPWRLFPWDAKVRIPSYIPTQTFTHALLDTIAPSSTSSPTPLLEVRRAVAYLPEHVRRPLLLSLNEAQGDLEKFRASLSAWYDNTMERVSGLYKRKTKLTVLMFAAIITIFTNADTVAIVRALSSNKSLRDALVAQADVTVNAGNDRKRDSSSTAPTTQAEKAAAIQKTVTDLRALGLPLGYIPLDSAQKGAIASAPIFGSPSRVGLYFDLYWPQLRKAWIGLLLTTLALSLGAPFWFDILNKIVNVRAVGRNPAENAKVAAGQRPT